MKRYKCKDCGLLFDEPEIEKSYLGVFHGQFIYDKNEKCPQCGSYELDYDENGFEED